MTVLKNKNKKTHTILLSVICLVFLVSCGVKTPVRQVSIEDVSRNLKYENIILKDISLSPGIRHNVPTQTPIMQCEETTITALQSKNIFKRVHKIKKEEHGESFKNLFEEPTLIIEPELTFLRIVSRAARFWGGIFSGRSTMILNVTLRDASDGTIIAKKELVGAPNVYASAYSIGGADVTLPQRMGYLLADYVLANVAER